MHGICTRCDTCPVRHNSICGALTDEELLQLSQLSRRKLVKAREPVFQAGDDADHYFNVVRGIVKLVKSLANGEQRIVDLIYPPDFLGQTIGGRHSFSAEAATDVEVCSFPRAPFEALLEIHPKLERRILAFTSRELDICRDWTLVLGRKSSYERVGSFIFMMAERLATAKCLGEADGAVRFRLPFTRAEIGDYLGLTLETVSRQLTRLRADHIIELPACREVIVPNMRRLAAAASIESRLSMEAVSPI